MGGSEAAQEGWLASEISEDIVKPRIFLQEFDSLWEHVHALSQVIFLKFSMTCYIQNNL